MKEKTDLRLSLLRNGYSPLPNVDKITKTLNWQNLEITEDEIRGWDRQHGTEATGLRLDKGLAVIDFDVDHPDVVELYAELEARWPELTRCPARGTTASPKEAWFFRVGEPFGRIYTATCTDGASGLTVEIFGGGSPRQFGSFGPHDLEGGSAYVWNDDVSPATVPLADLPVLPRSTVYAIRDFCQIWLADRFEPVEDSEGGENEAAHVHDLTEDMIFHTRELGDVEGLDALRDRVGRGYTYCSASFIDGPIAKNRRRCTITHDHAGGVAIWDSMTDITHHEAALAVTGPTDEATIGAARDMETLFADFGGMETGPGVDRADIPQYIMTAGERPTVRQISTNIAMWLNANLPSTFFYSQFDDEIWVERHLPYDPPTAPLPRTLQNRDLVRILQIVHHDVFPGIGKEKVMEAIEMVAFERERHPVREYLQALAWDGNSRLTSMAETYLGVRPRTAQEGAYAAAAVRKWMISAVARVMSPGCKADHMLILQGAQGVGKSTALDILAGEWFGDDLPPIDNKDAKEWVHGVWIAEMAELSAMGGKEVEHVKAFIAAKKDKFRRSYGRVTEQSPRQTVFAGTTNEDAYLLDTTGNRRFWPIMVTQVGIAALQRDRDLLWAEARVAFEAGEHWHLDREMDPAAFIGAQEAQQSARAETFEEVAVREWLVRQPDDARITARDAAQATIGTYGRKLTSMGGMHRQIPRAIKAAGWIACGRDKTKTVTYTRGPDALPYSASEDADTIVRKHLSLVKSDDED